MKITINDLKDLWVKFYQNKNHTLISSSSIVPENDASVLFTTAGMQPLVPYLLGQKHPLGTRLVDYQACIRTNDIESVGDASHLTFFEMLGRWSLGDYDKTDAIKMSFEFLTSKDYLGLPIDKLAVTAFEGDDNLPKDTEAYETWASLGIPKDRIFYLGKEHNWWALGETGPCGPDSEMFFVNESVLCDNPNCSPACSCGKYLEIGNDVFMSYNRQADGTLVELKNKNIDTGMGLERNVAVLNGLSSVYETDAFSGAISIIETLSGKKYGQNTSDTRAVRVICDHMRSSTVIMGDNTPTTPSNVGRGYVLRRLIRRSVNFAKRLNIDPFDLKQVVELYIENLGVYYPSIKQKSEIILTELEKEIKKFNNTLNAGLREFEKLVAKLEGDHIDGNTAFRLYDTFGFPIELTQELAQEKSLKVDIEGYKARFSEHQQISKGNAAVVFKSGLAGEGGVYNRYHTATHLLHAVLRSKFGESVHQAGSAITEDKMRFDFTFERKITQQELQEIENQVNEYIALKLPVTRHEVGKEQAKQMGAFGLFDEKYGDIVSVYTVGHAGSEISKEFCTGPHVNNTSEIGKFKIVKEESSSSGVRRIKAIVE